MTYAFLNGDLHTRYHCLEAESLGPGKRAEQRRAPGPAVNPCAVSSLRPCQDQSELEQLEFVPSQALAASESCYEGPAVAPCVTGPFHGNTNAFDCFPSVVVEKRKRQFIRGVRGKERQHFFFFFKLSNTACMIEWPVRVRHPENFHLSCSRLDHLPKSELTEEQGKV